MTSIRPATIEDIPTLGDLWAQLVLEEIPDASPNIKRWCDMQRALMANPDYHVWVSEVDGEVSGFTNGLILDDIQTRERYMDGGHLFVSKQYRDGFSGMKLHRLCYRICKENSARFVRRKVSAFNQRMVERMKKGLGNGHIIREYIVDEMIGGTT